MSNERQLIAQAATGDGAAFRTLTEPLFPEIEAFAYRLVAHPDEQADLVQDALIDASQMLGEFPEDVTFRTWLFALVTKKSFDHLRTRRQWGRNAYQAGMAEVSRNKADQEALAGVLSDPDFQFDPAEHVAFCFTSAGRALPPHQSAALLLQHVFGFERAEAAQVLGVESSLVEALSVEAQESLQDLYGSVCRLENPEGDCFLCHDLYEAVGEDGRRGKVPAEIGRPEEAAETRFNNRLQIVQNARLAGGRSRTLHDFLLRGLRRQEEQSASPDVEEDDVPDSE